MIGDANKRAFHRMLIDAELRIWVGQQSYSGVCKDLSATGMGISLKGVQLVLGDEVEVALSGEGVAPFSAKGKVVRCNGDVNVDCAIEFTSLS
ncbi:PilZ domain-containing protein [Agarivorans sp. TSD2052]|uniref:PilZ domain-containing protein n=1 Tax=Agarivorans sp. TSD2052 TaxID=2937286 RepID=UPI00200BD4BB|nr:PilZ domain-containing protein [Agarivorans sp. TSD2052]UPW18019.1 PilZ domain-containing protein [Agarivorans sp. TSD2052]